MDNGWNSSEAANNISNLVAGLGVDLFTHVTDWETQKHLQKAFFDADVIDVELIYDNCMEAVCFQLARKYKIGYVIGGNNNATEGVSIPRDWAAPDKWDATNIRSIAKSFGVRLGDFPLYSNLDWLIDRIIHGIQWIPLLDFLPEYNKSTATETLTSAYGYKPYSTKHFENVFTRFYQGYILPNKFGVDKRRPHLSSLIVSGQLAREDALSIIQHDSGYSTHDSESDEAFVLTKLSMSQEDFNQYIRRPRREHSEWKMDRTRKYLWPILTTINRDFRGGRPI
jgi:hypothetical protein